MVLVGNKADLYSDRAVNCEEGEKLAVKYGNKKCSFMEVSAKTQRSVDQIFIDVVRQLAAISPVEKKRKRPCNLL